MKIQRHHDIHDQITTTSTTMTVLGNLTDNTFTPVIALDSLFAPTDMHLIWRVQTATWLIPSASESHFFVMTLSKRGASGQRSQNVSSIHLQLIHPKKPRAPRQKRRQLQKRRPPPQPKNQRHKPLSPILRFAME